MRKFFVYRTITQYARHVTEGGVILWTSDANGAHPMTRAEATALADKLQRSASLNGPQYQAAGEYGIEAQEVKPANDD